MFQRKPTAKITENIYLISSGYVNFYLFKTPTAAVCIDTAAKAETARAELAKAELTPESISHIFLTHSDSDHAGGLDVFPMARLFLSELEVPLLTGKVRRALLIGRPRINRAYTMLKDGDEVRIADIKVKAISTPGHTIGSMSYLINDRYLFTGDTLSLNRGRAQNFPAIINMETSREKMSIRKLAQLKGVALLCTAHHGFTFDFEKALSDWR